MNNNKQYFRTSKLRKQLLSFFYMIPFIICIISAIITTIAIAELDTTTNLSMAENTSSISTMLPLSQNKQEVEA